ncbi:hypothetical protein pEaSNUABM56_00114 [Erwinia phage pEa_SNUABM_56]|uniref:Phage neck terminator protein gp12-like domain-containing protein n=1 Tax=Erwinia phage pEp_SNUABM_01 TaxID=2601643 RepID=A0A5J6DBB0_9CAUD|nr:hypothetical protein HWC63_gp087 [Erwinia phage pEp_SNUABM_01]QEQ94913.1 hypothetical protein pEpSNUABM01_087 [Erwinia phage pEp_SNUABM_01]UYL85159.1 hypothetical protein pEaSNUABM56_00114 [Erwinia phage pEa_SNUABM_56]
MAGFVNTDEVFDLLTKTLGRLSKEVTGRKVVLDDDETIPKVDEEFILVSQTAATQLDWTDNEWQDELGNAAVSHNYEVTYTLTAYRGKAFADLTKVLQSLNLPFFYEKYFPSPSAFAYSSSSTISRLRIPLNMQKFENRAVVIITFNVNFMAVDTQAFEDIDKINMQMVYSFNDPTTT